jgi:hypothetical protein
MMGHNPSIDPKRVACVRAISDSVCDAFPFNREVSLPVRNTIPFEKAMLFHGGCSLIWELAFVLFYDFVPHLNHIVRYPFASGTGRLQNPEPG